MEIKDSGERTTYETGGMREITEDKGRCDLIYNNAFAKIFDDEIFYYVEEFVRRGNIEYIYAVIHSFIEKAYKNKKYTAYLELAKHYQQGSKKYAERNMEKGLPFHTFIDSGLRHYVKWLRKDKDEPHDRAFLWNMITLIYMYDNKPEMNDLPYKKGE